MQIYNRVKRHTHKNRYSQAPNVCHLRTPAMIGCSFVANREYFGEIGLLDPGMEVYGGENIELGMRVSLPIVYQAHY